MASANMTPLVCAFASAGQDGFFVLLLRGGQFSCPTFLHFLPRTSQPLQRVTMLMPIHPQEGSPPTQQEPFFAMPLDFVCYVWAPVSCDWVGACKQRGLQGRSKVERGKNVTPRQPVSIFWALASVVCCCPTQQSRTTLLRLTILFASRMN
jgi:hypothetical protein